MEYSISPISAEDRESIIDIFNYYVENSFAVYPESKLPYQAFDLFLQMSKDLPTATIKNHKGDLLGFGMLRIYNPMPAFSKTAEITYFIGSDQTGKGFGKILLEFLERGGRERGIKTILANISSLNTGSIKFHKNNGFIECGCFKQVGIKKGKTFDTIWMQKML
jgi:L-amino acid N-acyltransferase YncA